MGEGVSKGQQRRRPLNQRRGNITVCHRLKKEGRKEGRRRKEK